MKLAQSRFVGRDLWLYNLILQALGSSGDGGSGVLSVANIPALEAVVTTELLPGTIAYVQSPKSYWNLDKTSTASPNGETVVAATVQGNWLLQDAVGLQPYASVLAFAGIDPTGATDSETGLTNAFAALAGTGVSPFVPAGTYLCNLEPTVPAGLDLLIGTGASFTGAGGVALTTLLGSTTHFQAGTTGAPTESVYLSIQPVDRTKAPFQITLGGASFLGEWDSVLYYGYNASASVASEPIFRWNIEQDYQEAPGVHWFESYWEFYDQTRAIHLRPFYCQVDRSSGQSSLVVQTGTGTNDSLSQVDGAGAAIWSSYAGSFRFVRAGYELLWTAPATGGMIVSLNAAGTQFFYDMQHLAGDVLVLGSTAGHSLLRLDVVANGFVGVGGALVGYSAGAEAPVVLGSTTGVSAALSFALSTAQQSTPVIQLTGTVPGGGTTITVPNTVGAWWKFDVSAVTLTGNLTFTTGSGTPAVVSAVDLGANKRLIDVVVSASNVVSWG